MSARGTTNRNDRGSTESRRRRRRWLLEVWAADRPLIRVERRYSDDVDVIYVDPGAISGMIETFVENYRAEDLEDEDWLGTTAEIVPACRCYRCGKLLAEDQITVDRIIPGCRGGTYRRDNIRPACGHCNSITGNDLREALKARKEARRRPRSPIDVAEPPFSPSEAPEWTLS